DCAGMFADERGPPLSFRTECGDEGGAGHMRQGSRCEADAADDRNMRARVISDRWSQEISPRPFGGVLAQGNPSACHAADLRGKPRRHLMQNDREHAEKQESEIFGTEKHEVEELGRFPETIGEGRDDLNREAERNAGEYQRERLGKQELESAE